MFPRSLSLTVAVAAAAAADVVVVTAVAAAVVPLPMSPFNSSFSLLSCSSLSCSCPRALFHAFFSPFSLSLHPPPLPLHPLVHLQLNADSKQDSLFQKGPAFPHLSLSDSELLAQTAALTSKSSVIPQAIVKEQQQKGRDSFLSLSQAACALCPQKEAEERR